MAIHYQSILAVTGLITAVGIAGQFDYEEEQQQVKQYCDMVKLWKKTGGQAGWPAYDGEEVCRASRAERDPAPVEVLNDLDDRIINLIKEGLGVAYGG